jgi:hypothetical protein
MEAADTSETSVYFTRLHGATTQQTAIFLVWFYFVSVYIRKNKELSIRSECGGILYEDIGYGKELKSVLKWGRAGGLHLSACPCIFMLLDSLDCFVR